MTAVSLNGVDLSTAIVAAGAVVDVVRVNRPLVGRRRHQRVEVPGRAAPWTFPEEPGDGSLELVLALTGDTFTERRAAVRALAAWADLAEPAALIVDDEPDRYYMAILSRTTEPEEWLTAARPALTFDVDAYAYAVTPSVETFTVTSSGDGDTWSIPDAVHAYPVIELTPTVGAITGGVVLDVNGYELTYDAAIANGDTITISSVASIVTTGAAPSGSLDGIYDAGDVSMEDVSGRFPLLLPGSNTYTLDYTGSATSISVEITWRRRFY